MIRRVTMCALIAAAMPLLATCGSGELCVDASKNYSCASCSIELCENDDHSCTWYRTSDGKEYQAGCPLDANEAVIALRSAKAQCGCE